MGVAPSGNFWDQFPTHPGVLGPGTLTSGGTLPAPGFAPTAPSNTSATTQVQPNSATAPVAGGGTPPSTSFPSVQAYVQYLSTQPGADPTLASDPNYWIGKINETGGLTSGNIGYWNTRSQAGAGNTGGGGAAGGGSNPLGAGIGFQAPGAFVPPTGVTMQNDPAFQFDQQQGEKAINDSAAAKGTLLTSGNSKNLINYAEGGALNAYQNVFNNAQSAYNTNAQTGLGYDTLNANTLLGFSGQGLNAADAATSAGGQLGTTDANLITGNANAQGAGDITKGKNYATWLAGFDPTTQAKITQYLSANGQG